MTVLRCLMAFALAGLAASCAWAGAASGNFKVEGAKPGEITPVHAAAFETRDPYDPHRRLVEIVLSGAPVDVEAALATLHPHTHVINQQALRDHDYVLMWLKEDGRLDANATFREGMVQYLARSGPGLRVTLDINTASHVAGQVQSTAPVNTQSGDRYGFDLRFDTDIARPARGTPLKKGGEAPGKALLGLLASARALRWPAIRAACTPEAMRFFEADYRSQRENAEMTRDLLTTWLPKKRLRIVGGERRGDTADLEIEGEMHPGLRALYLARMREVDGVWRFESANLAGLLP